MEGAPGGEEAPQATDSRLRRQIDSDVKALDELHARVRWTPQSGCVRPTAEEREAKHRLLETASRRYLNSTQDYILARVFHLPTRAVSKSFSDQRVTVDEKGLASARQGAMANGAGWLMVFAPNMFPYQVPEGTHHYVLWYLLDPENPSHVPGEDDINKAINGHLASLVKTGDYEFVWYRNPKPTIAGGDGLTYHVQVFWHERV